MRAPLGQQIAALVESATDDRGAALAADLWKAGRRRRLWTAARSLVAVAAALACLGFVAWPGVQPATPMSPGSSTRSGEPARTYPSVVAEPHFPPSALEAHRPMAAVYVARETTYAVDDHGQTWKTPKASGDLAYAALSPDGRYATDGREVYDFVAGRGTRLAAFDRLPPGYVRVAAGWSPDSRHYAVVADAGTTARVGVGAPAGGFVPAPVLPSGDPSGTASVRVAWLDNTRVLLLVPAASTQEDAARGSSLMAYTWALGDAVWRPRGALQLPPHSVTTYREGYAADVSPDGRIVALSVNVQDGERSGAALMTWTLPTTGQKARRTAVVPPSGLSIDGITWRGQDLVASRNGITTVVRTGQVLSEAGSGSGRPISWRAGAFAGTPYYNSLAVWRDRLFVWAVLLGTLTLIVLGIRLGSPLARRAGLLGRYASPFPLEARWMFTRY